MLVNQFIESRIVASGVLVEHVLVFRLGGVADDCLQVRRQPFPHLLVDGQLQRRAGLLPTGVVVILCHPLQAKGQVVIRANPICRINGAGLQGGKDLCPGQLYRRGADLAQHLPGQTGHAHLQPFQVLNAVDFLVEPARHLRTGVTAGERFQVELGIQVIPQFLAATMVQPAIHFLGG